jgi:hypothetical protein
MNEGKLKDSFIKVADKINQKRRQEIFDLYANKDGFLSALKKIRDSERYRKGSKSKVWRLVASYPEVVHDFFRKVYGEDYYKDKDFFKKYGREWLTIREDQL